MHKPSGGPSGELSRRARNAIPAHETAVRSSRQRKEGSMDNDRDIILRAYAESLQVVYRAFFVAYTDAQTDPQGEQETEQRFRAGVLHARHIRDRALELLS